MNRPIGILAGLGALGAISAVLLTAVIADAGAMSAVALDGVPRATDSVDARYYRSSVSAIEPAVRGLSLEAEPDGAVSLVNHTGKTVTVLGYAGEPYLRIGPTGVDENVNSLTAALNAVPGLTSKNATSPVPDWQHRSDSQTAMWRDYRTHWSNGQRPPIVAADPHHPHRVLTWAMPLTVAAQPVLVHGVVQWTGSPRFSHLQLEAAAGVVVLVLLAGLLSIRRLRSRRRRREQEVRVVHQVPRPASRRPSENLFQEGQPKEAVEHTKGA